MADKNDKWEQNVPGKFYVDQQCIACDACVTEAIGFFFMNEDDGHAYIIKQPQKKHEVEACLTALEICPVEAIGQDGDD